MSRRTHLFVLVAACSLALGLQACAPRAQESCNFVQNSYGQRVSWAKDPITLYADNSVPAEALPSIRRAMETWNRALGGQALQLGGWVSGGKPGRDGSNVIYWFRAWQKDRPFEQARTTIHWMSTDIYEADIKINGENFSYAFGDHPVAGRVDFESLMLHELGHVLGLAHTPASEESVMHAYLRSSSLRREPMNIDLTSLSCEYRVAGLEQ